MDGNPDESSLVRWDLNAIPASSTVQSVSLTVNVTNSTTNAYQIYEIKRPWVEGARHGINFPRAMIGKLLAPMDQMIAGPPW